MSDIELNRDDVSERKTDWKRDRLGHVRSSGAIKEPKLNGRNIVITQSFVQANFQWLFKPPSMNFHPIKYAIVFSLCSRVWILIFGLFNNDLIV